MKILKVILAGRIYAADIAKAMNLPVARIYTPLRRLRSAGHIYSKRDTKRKRMTYQIKGIDCLLADIW